jgi:gliding motility-associated-like protein
VQARYRYWYNCKHVFFPSAFTPNQDGKNDIFKPIITGNIKHYEFFIYNRWGQVVFRTTDATKGWDGKFLGKEQNNNVFIWQCSYQFEGEAIRTQKGTVILIK